MLQARLCSRPGYAAGQAMLQARLCCRPGYAAGQAMLQARPTVKHLLVFRQRSAEIFFKENALFFIFV